MRLTGGILLTLAACAHLTACDNIPGSRIYNLRQDVEAAVKSNIRDPESARFSGVEYFVDRSLACGKVNYKNVFGGYAGDSQFAYYEGVAYSLDWSRDTNQYLWVLHECGTEHLRKLRLENPNVKFPDQEKFKPI